MAGESVVVDLTAVGLDLAVSSQGALVGCHAELKNATSDLTVTDSAAVMTDRLDITEASPLCDGESLDCVDSVDGISLLGTLLCSGPALLEGRSAAMDNGLLDREFITDLNEATSIVDNSAGMELRGIVDKVARHDAIVTVVTLDKFAVGGYIFAGCDIPVLNDWH